MPEDRTLSAAYPPPRADRVGVRASVPANVADDAARFGADLRAAVSAWRRAPMLPVVSTAAAIMVQILASQRWTGVLALLLLGVPGLERLWYLRVFTSRQLSPAE